MQEPRRDIEVYKVRMGKLISYNKYTVQVSSTNSSVLYLSRKGRGSKKLSVSRATVEHFKPSTRLMYRLFDNRFDLLFALHSIDTTKLTEQVTREIKASQRKEPERWA